MKIHGMNFQSIWLAQTSYQSFRSSNDKIVIMACCKMSRDSRVNMISSLLKLHTNAHTVRPILKDVELVRNGSNLKRDRELYERTFMS